MVLIKDQSHKSWFSWFCHAMNKFQSLNTPGVNIHSHVLLQDTLGDKLRETWQVFWWKISLNSLLCKLFQLHSESPDSLISSGEWSWWCEFLILGWCVICPSNNMPLWWETVGDSCSKSQKAPSKRVSKPIRYCPTVIIAISWGQPSLQITWPLYEF